MKLHEIMIIAAAMCASSASALSPDRSVAQDVADVSTDVCYLLASGGLVWEPRDVDEEIRQVQAAGMVYGIPGVVVDRIGASGRLFINRATLAHRTNGDSIVVLANNGSIPGCRVLLAAEDTDIDVAAFEAALVARGWRNSDSLAGRIDGKEFIRVDANRRVYILRLVIAGDSTDRPRLFTTVRRLGWDVR